MPALVEIRNMGDASGFAKKYLTLKLMNSPAIVTSFQRNRESMIKVKLLSEALDSN